MLLEQGADPHATSRLGVSALTIAAGNGAGEIVEMLMDAGVDANSPMPDGDTALMLAARTGNRQAVESLLAHGADVNAVEPVQGETALMWAAAQNHAEVIRVLVERGADIETASKGLEWDGFTQTGVASYLPLGGLTALLHAARENAIEAARALLELGADPNVANPIGISALRIALTNGHWDMAKVLLDAGADPNDGALVEAARTRAWPFVRAEKNRPDETDSLALIREMLDRGADPNKVPEEPMSMQYWTIGKLRNDPPLYIAAREADFELLDLLVEYGATPEQSINPEGATLLVAALGLGPHALGGGVPAPPRDFELAKRTADAVLALGTEIDTGRKDGMTALHLAAGEGRDDIVRYLVDIGARLDIKDRSNRLPIHVAMGVPRVPMPDDPPMPNRNPPVFDSTTSLLREAMAAAGIAEEPYVKPPSVKSK
jgi:ankyrin repeat protein